LSGAIALCGGSVVSGCSGDERSKETSVSVDNLEFGPALVLMIEYFGGLNIAEPAMVRPALCDQQKDVGQLIAAYQQYVSTNGVLRLQAPSVDQTAGAGETTADLKLGDVIMQVTVTLEGSGSALCISQVDSGSWQLPLW